MAEPTQKRSPAHGPRWAGLAAHTWTITQSGPGSSVLQRGTLPRPAPGSVRSRYELQLRETIRSEASRPPHLTPLVPSEEYKATCPSSLPSSHLLYSITHNFISHLTWHLEDTGMAATHHSKPGLFPFLCHQTSRDCWGCSRAEGQF